MANSKDTVSQDLSTKTPVLSCTTVKHKIPPSTQTREKSMARQLDDSFADLHTGARPQTSSDLKESVDLDGSPTSMFLMSELRKLSEEVRIRDEQCPKERWCNATERWDDNIICVVTKGSNDCFRIGKTKLEYDESSLEPERAAQWSRKFPPGTST